MPFSRRTYLLIFGAIVLIILAAFAGNRYIKEQADAKLAAEIDTALMPLFSPKEPGAAVIVIKDGRTVFRKAFGLSDLEKGFPLRPESVFRIGSITKQFTAVAILMLADQGKLSVTNF